MDAGGLAQMSQANNFAMRPAGGLASRRGGGGVAPLSFDALKSPVEPSAPTPRTTARAHLLAGLRTAPKSATAASFAASGTVTGVPTQARNRNSMAASYGHDSILNGPRTSIPTGFALQQQQQQAFAGYAQQAQQQAQQKAQAQAQQQAQAQAQAQAIQQQQAQAQAIQQQQARLQQQLYTADQILAPPEIHIEEQSPENMDPAVYANLVNTNMYLAQQQQRLQQQLMSLQAAQQQFQNLNLNGQSGYQNMYQQQQQQQQQAHLNMLMQGMTTGQGTIYTVFDPATGQNSYYLDQSTAQNQQYDQFNGGYQSQQTPRVQVSPPPAEMNNGFRNNSPPRRFESPEQHAPLPPPSANAFRRGHKKSGSVSNKDGSLSVSLLESGSKTPGPKTASFPLTPLTGGYGPGQARAGEHPVRQPRGPPSFDELRTKPTSKHDGSKNFAGRTRRSALSNLVRAGITRREVKSTGSSGTASPISEIAEELPTPLTEDGESVSGRSGSGSLNGDDDDCAPPSSRTSTGSWGAIGSDRPSSRQKKARQQSVDSLSNASDNESGSVGGSSFASVFKGTRKPQGNEAVGQRKAPMIVLGRGAEKRKTVPGAVPVA
ncbi:hypothetical protein RB597_009430 [Gaeumannomyces tritici]